MTTTSNACIPKSNKRKRLPGDGKVVTEDRAIDLSFTDLPMIPILQFLEPEDRLPLSATCKFGLEAVENYCELILEAIVGPNNCKVDETFWERISRVFNRERREHEVLFPKNDNASYKLPFRLLLEKAKSTPLDQISMKNQAKDYVYDQMSPSGTKIAVKTKHGGIEVIDLATKACVAVLNVEVAEKRLALNRGDLIIWRFLGDDRILLMSRKWIICWHFLLGSSESTTPTENHCVHLLYHFHTLGRLVDILTIGADEFAFVEWRGPERFCEVRSMNLRDGSTKTLFKKSSCGYIQLLAATTTSSNIGNKWLIFHFANSVSDDYKLYVYNLEKMELADVWDKKYCAKNCFVWQNASRGNKKVQICYARDHWKGDLTILKVLNLDENTGKLSLCRKMEVHYPDTNYDVETDVVALAGNRVIVGFLFYTDDTDDGSEACSAFVFNLNSTSKKSYEKRGQLITSPERKISSGAGCWWAATVSTVHNAWYLRKSNQNQIMVYLHSEPTLS